MQIPETRLVESGILVETFSLILLDVFFVCPQNLLSDGKLESFFKIKCVNVLFQWVSDLLVS